MHALDLYLPTIFMYTDQTFVFALARLFKLFIWTTREPLDWEEMADWLADVKTNYAKRVAGMTGYYFFSFERLSQKNLHAGNANHLPICFRLHLYVTW